MLNLELADVDPTYAAQHPDCELQLFYSDGTPTGVHEAVILDATNYTLARADGRDEHSAARNAIAQPNANDNRRRGTAVTTHCGSNHRNVIHVGEEDRDRPATYRCTFAGCTDVFPAGNRTE